MRMREREREEQDGGETWRWSRESEAAEHVLISPAADGAEVRRSSEGIEPTSC